MKIDDLLGTTVAGKYRLERLLGQGGMGVVFEAVNVQLGRRVALKRLRSGAVHDPTQVARFHQEARAAAAIGSDHIVDILDIVQDDEGTPWIVMELLVGQSLAQRLARERRLEPDVAVPVLLQVLAGLAVAHGRGVVHRDLKPENLYLEEREDGTALVKILDFGISKIQDASLATPDKLTATGTMMGTAHYMSPEQARGRSDLDHRSDLYSAGAILFECLAGRTPFEATSYNEMIAKLLTEDPPAIESLVPDLPAALAAAVHKSMARERDDRFSSATEMQAALATAMGYPLPRTTPAPRVITPAPGSVSSIPGIPGIPGIPSVPSAPSGPRAVVTPLETTMSAQATPSPPRDEIEHAHTAVDQARAPVPTPLAGESSRRQAVRPRTGPRQTVWLGVAIAALVVAGAWVASSRSHRLEGAAQRPSPSRTVVGSDAGTKADHLAHDAGTAAPVPPPAPRHLRVVVTRPASGARIRVGGEEHAANEWVFELPADSGAVAVTVSAPGHHDKTVVHDPTSGDLVVELARVRASDIDEKNPYRGHR